MGLSYVTLPGTGAGIACIADGTGDHQCMVQEFLPTAGSTTPTQTDNAANCFPIREYPRMQVVAAAAVTRPANVTVYSANDAVSNNATPASVTPISFTLSDINDAPVSLERVRIASSDTGPGAAGAAFRIWLYRSDPTASSGVVGGDNLAFSTKQGTFIGSMAGSFFAFSDGSVAVLTPENGSRIITLPTSGAQTVFGLLQTLTAFTPSANSTTFTCTVEGLQGRA